MKNVNSGINFISHLNMSLTRKKIISKTKIDPKNIKTLILLHNIGCVRNFIILTKKPLTLKYSILFYKYRPFFSHINVITTPTKKFYVTYKTLKKISHKTYLSILIISTSKGLLTLNDCLKFRLGGVLMYVLT